MTMLRFVDACGGSLELRVAAEWFDQPGGVLRGHSWVELDGVVLEGPPESHAHLGLWPVSLRRASGGLARVESEHPDDV
jgi:hypothetical protein